VTLSRDILATPRDCCSIRFYSNLSFGARLDCRESQDRIEKGAKQMRNSFSVAVIAATTFAGLAIAQPAKHYDVKDLGTLPGGTFSQATSVNDYGFVAGVSTINSSATSPQHAVVWYPPGLVIDIGKPGLKGPNSVAYGINDFGLVVGQAETPTKDPNNENFCGYGDGLECLPFRWQYGVMTALPLLGGNNGQMGFTANNHGQVPGAAENSVRDPKCVAPQVLDFEPVIWGPEPIWGSGPGPIQKLALLHGDTVGMATWINDHGEAVGTSGTCANSVILPEIAGPHAVLWEVNGSVTDLGNLGGAGANIALSINNAGQVVGLSSIVSTAAPPACCFDAFLWTRETGKMRDLGRLPGDAASGAGGINESGVVIGTSFALDGSPRAFVWYNGVMTDLNTLVPADSPLYLLFANSINASGEIAGWGATSGGEIHAFLLTPSHGDDDDRSSRAEASSAAQIPLPENIRKQLAGRLGFGRR
jgi:probable HAF family extracellular repeat protein